MGRVAGRPFGWAALATALAVGALGAACGEQADQASAPAGSASPAAPAAASAAPQATAIAGGPAQRDEGDSGARKDQAETPVPRSPEKAPDWGGGPSPTAPAERGPGGKPTMLAAVAFDLEGKLSADEVRKTIDDSRDKFSRCLTSDASVNVKAKVLPSGALSDVSVPSSLPDDPKLRDCVAAVLKGLTFPRPKGGEPASLRLDLALKRPVSF